MEDNNQKALDELIDLLDLEKLEENIFRGKSHFMGSPNIFGGHVLAQGLQAATHTVPADRFAHSLHAYFILPGDINRPIIYEVDTIRDGGSFTTRRIIAIQHGRPIFNMAASFQLKQEGHHHQIEMPDVPSPANLESREELFKKYFDDWPDRVKFFFSIPQPIEFRFVEGYDPVFSGKQSPNRHIWMKAKGKLNDDPLLHKAVLTYASDYNLLGTAMLPHGDKASFINTQMASLDHAMWFHRDFRADEWMLCVIDSPSSASARGFSRNSIYNEQGTLIASAVQEGLMRPRPDWELKKKA